MNKLNQYFRLLLKPEERSLKIKSIRAAVWSLLGRGGSRVLRLASSLILTRILFPEAFGLMATASVILAMLQLFADTGVRTAIIQNPRGAEPEFLNTAWIVSIGRGFILFFVILAMSYPMSRFYGQPELAGLMAVLALNPLIGGFENPALALVVKKFRIEKQVAYELGSHLMSVVTAILFALWLKSVYALAVGAVSLVIYRVFASYVVEPYRPRLEWNKEAGAELFLFGKYIFLNTLVTWAVMNADVILIGKLLNMELLGFYNLGNNIGVVVSTFCLLIFMQSYMPAVSSVCHDLPRVVEIYKRSSALILAVAVPVSAVAALFSKDIVGLLYDPRYSPAAIAMFWTSLAGVFRIVGLAAGNTFIAMGKPKYETMAMSVGLALAAVLVSWGALRHGLPGAAFGMFCAVTAISVLESILLVVGLGFPLKVVLRPWLQAISAGGAAFGAYYAAGRLFQEGWYGNVPFLLAISAISLIVSLGVYVLMEGRNPFRDRGGATHKQLLDS